MYCNVFHAPPTHPSCAERESVHCSFRCPCLCHCAAYSIAMECFESRAYIEMSCVPTNWIGRCGLVVWSHEARSCYVRLCRVGGFIHYVFMFTTINKYLTDDATHGDNGANVELDCCMKTVPFVILFDVVCFYYCCIGFHRVQTLMLRNYYMVWFGAFELLRSVLAGTFSKPLWSTTTWSEWAHTTSSLRLKRKRKEEQRIVASKAQKKPATLKSRKRTPFTLKRIKVIERTGVTIRRRPAKAK